MDLQPLYTAKPLFSHHAPGALTLGGIRYTAPVRVLPDGAPDSVHRSQQSDVFKWVEQTASELREAQAEVVLIGTGSRLHFPSIPLRQQLCEMGLMNVEWMDTPAACRTYNLLSGEGRRVAGLFWVE